MGDGGDTCSLSKAEVVTLLHFAGIGLILPQFPDLPALFGVVCVDFGRGAAVWYGGE